MPVRTTARLASAVPVMLAVSLVLGCSGCGTSSGEPDGAGGNPSEVKGDAAIPGADDGGETQSGDGSATHDEPDGSTADLTDAATPGGDGAAPGPGPAGCKALTVQAGAKIDGSNADTFAWSDDHCLPRTASLLRNDAKDAYGEHGGYLRAIGYQVAGKNRDIRGTGVNGWQGFGYIVNHYASSSTTTQGTAGAYRTVLAGRHHAIHEFTWTISPGGTVKVTAQWIFATGRAHPLFAVSFDATPAGSNTVKADSRAPYGDLAWDNGANGDVSGDGWGDTHKFTTTGTGPVTSTSPWDYTKPNTIPYAFEWSNATDAEMGLVATVPWSVHQQGGDYAGGALMNQWGKTGTKFLTDIPDYEWPYQLNQYEIPAETKSHRVAWGTTYGNVGTASFTSFGQTLSGYPFESYTVAVVLGTHTTSAVAAQVGATEATAGASITASRGTVATNGIAGVGRTDKVTYAPAGFDPVYAAWTVDAASNVATVTFRPGTAPVTNPMFDIRGYTASSPPKVVTFGGRSLVADVDYFATVDATGQRLWLTLNLAADSSAVLTVD